MVVWVNEPLVAVIVTVKVPGAVEEHDRVAMLEVARVTVAGVTMQAIPAGETADTILTVPANPFTPFTVIVEVAVAPTLIVKVVGLDTTLKSCRLTVTVAECERDPLVPVTVTL